MPFSSETPALARNLPLDLVPYSPIQPGLEHIPGWVVHSLSGQPASVPHNPQSKGFSELRINISKNY